MRFLREFAREGALLLDDTGLGKSVMTSYALRKLPKPIVVVCPNPVKSVWYGTDATRKRPEPVVGALERFGKLTPVQLQGIKPEEDYRPFDHGDATVINYEILHAWQEKLAGVAKTIVFDEAQYLLNARSQRSKAAKQIAHAAECRIGLTATPMQSRVKDLWNVMDTISPGRFGVFFSQYKSNFAMRYCDAHQKEITLYGEEEPRKVWNFDGRSNTKELRRRLRACTLRRTKKEVQLQIPSMRRQILEVNAANDRVKPFSGSLQGFRTMMDRGLSSAAHGKVNYVADLAADRVQENSSVIVWVREKKIGREIADALSKRKVRAYIINGEISTQKREQIADEARKNAPSVIVATMDSLRTGVNYLTFADVGIYAELHYVPEAIIQTEGRLHRPGQENPVIFYYVVALGTIDEYVRDRVLAKLEDYEEIIGKQDDGFKHELAGSQSEDEILADLRRAILNSAA